jgi:hypothetical protein
MDKIIDYIQINYLNIFSYVSSVINIFSSFKLSLSLGIFLIFLAIVSIIFSFLVFKFNFDIKAYIKNIIVFFVFIFFISLTIYFLNLLSFNFDFLNNEISETIEFKNIVFNSLKLIISYYLLVAFIEEASKHFNFLSSSLIKIDSIST